MPPLDAEYAAWPIWPSKAAALAMLTIAPRSPLSVGSLREIAVPTRRMQSKVPIRLIAITFENASRSAAELEVAVAADRSLGPADARGVDQHAHRSELLGLRDGGLDLLGLGHVDGCEDAADLVSGRLPLVGVQVGDDDLRALGCELTGYGCPDAGGAAGDDCTGSVDVHARRS